MLTEVPYFGEILALTTAIVWASAVILFKKSGETVSPNALNIFKNIFAFILIIPTMLILGQIILLPAPANVYLVFLASGALGIGLADSLFFKSLNLLGASRTAIVDCAYSPFIISLSILWLGESLGVLQIVGVVLIVTAVFSVTWEKQTESIDRKRLIKGIIYGLTAQAAMAVGIVWVKPLLEQYPLLWVMEVRLAGGIIVLFVVMFFHKNRNGYIRTFKDVRNFKYMIPGSFVGTYLALMLWLGGMKFTQASTASALNQTANIFIFIFAAIFLREKITKARLVGIIMGVGGVLLVTFQV